MLGFWSLVQDIDCYYDRLIILKVGIVYKEIQSLSIVLRDYGIRKDWSLKMVLEE